MTQYIKTQKPIIIDAYEIVNVSERQANGLIVITKDDGSIYAVEDHQLPVAGDNDQAEIGDYLWFSEHNPFGSVYKKERFHELYTKIA